MSTYNTPKSVRAAAEAILDGFTWAKTKQGEDYWMKIHDEIEAIAKQFEQKELEVSQHDIKPGQKFQFVGDSIRSKEDPERVLVKVANIYGIAETYFMEVETFKVYSFWDFAETLIPID